MGKTVFMLFLISLFSNTEYKFCPCLDSEEYQNEYFEYFHSIEWIQLIVFCGFSWPQMLHWPKRNLNR